MRPFEKYSVYIFELIIRILNILFGLVGELKIAGFIACRWLQ